MQISISNLLLKQLRWNRGWASISREQIWPIASGGYWRSSCSSSTYDRSLFLDCYGNCRLILQMQFVSDSWILPANRSSTIPNNDEYTEIYHKDSWKLVNWCKMLLKFFEQNWERRENFRFDFLLWWKVIMQLWLESQILLRINNIYGSLIHPLTLISEQ